MPSNLSAEMDAATIRARSARSLVGQSRLRLSGRACCFGGPGRTCYGARRPQKDGHRSGTSASRAGAPAFDPDGAYRRARAGLLGDAGAITSASAGTYTHFDARDGRRHMACSMWCPRDRTRRPGPIPVCRSPGGAFWTSFTLDRARGFCTCPPAIRRGISTRSTHRRGSLCGFRDCAGCGHRAGLGYNQLVKRDSHDWDVDSAPALVTTRRDAGSCLANKDGLLSIPGSLVPSAQRPASLPAGSPPVIPLLSQTRRRPRAQCGRAALGRPPGAFLSGHLGAANGTGRPSARRPTHVRRGG